MDGPASHTALWHIPRSDHHVSAVCCFENRWDVVGVMTEIRIQIQESVIRVADCVLKSCQGGCSQTFFLFAVQQLNLRIVRGEFPDSVARSVRRVVVNDQHVRWVWVTPQSEPWVATSGNMKFPLESS